MTSKADPNTNPTSDNGSTNKMASPGPHSDQVKDTESGLDDTTNSGQTEATVRTTRKRRRKTSPKPPKTNVKRSKTYRPCKEMVDPAIQHGVVPAQKVKELGLQLGQSGDPHGLFIKDDPKTDESKPRKMVAAGQVPYMIHLLPKRYRVYIDAVNSLGIPGFYTDLPLAPTPPDQLKTNTKITFIPYGRMPDTYRLNNKGNKPGDAPYPELPAYIRVNKAGTIAVDKGAKTTDMDIIWPFKRFRDDPGLLARLADKRRREFKEWLEQATEVWKEETIVYKVKRIVWETAMVKELAEKGTGLQWWPEADLVKIRRKSAKEIIIEALCTNLGCPPEQDTATFKNLPSQPREEDLSFDEKVNERAMQIIKELAENQLEQQRQQTKDGSIADLRQSMPHPFIISPLPSSVQESAEERTREIDRQRQLEIERQLEIDRL